MSANLAALLYLASAVLFILALRGLSNPESARMGNVFGMAGMALAILTTVLGPQVTAYGGIALAVCAGGAVGLVIAFRIKMAAMPQLVAAFHSLVGLGAVLVAAAAFYHPAGYGIVDALGQIKVQSRIEMSLGVVIGAVTFTGSIVAFTRLQGVISGDPVVFRGQHALNVVIGAVIVVLLGAFVHTPSADVFWVVTMLAFVLGVTLVAPIGGADMPVVISMLNSYSGWAAAGIGFTLENSALIVTGALVGSSGAILSYIMCRAMNRSFVSVILGGFGGETAGQTVRKADRSVTSGSAEDAAFILKNAASVVIVPGYGMAVAQAQHAVREMADALKRRGVRVSYAIHPVAGRMPGHMNVLLAEANVPYDEVFALEDINSEFQATDVAYVIGANDITNPAARDDPSSPIYGMPILDVDRAKTVLFVKRSLAPGYAGIDNALFYKSNTMMLFGDAKKMTEEIVKAL
ncbi:MAG TPA: NAD(P)(+) transhydrogenase (Re/Si-specific) subunit beta [bacterium]|nr:NAD(P)(+) transhydrogenase (Re/Si-specific) subunit beta [bacterium]